MVFLGAVSDPHLSSFWTQVGVGVCDQPLAVLGACPQPSGAAPQPSGAGPQPGGAGPQPRWPGYQPMAQQPKENNCKAHLSCKFVVALLEASVSNARARSALIILVLAVMFLCD